MIGIIGAGQMGIGIARLVSQHHPNVILYSRRDNTLGKIPKKIHTTNELKDLANCSIIIEAIKEDFKEKSTLLYHLTHNILCSPNNVLIASNTSSLSIKELSKSCINPSRMIGIHFINPISRIPICELIVPSNDITDYASSAADPAILKEGENFIKSLGKQIIRSEDRPGFIINRLLIPQIREAILLLGEGFSSRDEIDKAYRLATSSKIGPLALGDYIGLDVCLEVIKNIFVDSPQQPPPILSKMVKEGLLGRKVGEGFYKYPLLNKTSDFLDD